MGEATETGPHQGPSCPICGKPSVRDARPFCSRRCADVDLGRWLKGVYRVPTEEQPDVEAVEGTEDDDV